MSSVPALTIAHATPHPVGSGTEVDRFVERVTAGLAARGHRVLVVAPSPEGGDAREGRAAVRAARERPDDLFTEGAPRVLAVGEALTPFTGGRRAALPVDVTRTIEELHASLLLDICHVHEPFAPSVASAALRHSRALNVGTFHAPAERVVATQVARKVVRLVLGRLDARLASFAATRELMERFFPAEYHVLPPGADAAPRAACPSTRRSPPTASAGCCSSSAIPRRSPRRSRAWPTTRRCASACVTQAPRCARTCRGRASPTSTSRSTRRSPRAATTSAATRRRATACRGGG